MSDFSNAISPGAMKNIRKIYKLRTICISLNSHIFSVVVVVAGIIVVVGNWYHIKYMYTHLSREGEKERKKIILWKIQKPHINKRNKCPFYEN